MCLCLLRFRFTSLPLPCSPGVLLAGVIVITADDAGICTENVYSARAVTFLRSRRERKSADNARLTVRSRMRHEPPSPLPLTLHERNVEYP